MAYYYKKKKFYNKPVDFQGEHFDSKKEFDRYGVLRLLQRGGQIQNLRRQVKFVLLPAKKGKYRNERECAYIADFVYEQNGELIVEDVKGMRTKEYIIKRKLMLAKYDISLKES